MAKLILKSSNPHTIIFVKADKTALQENFTKQVYFNLESKLTRFTEFEFGWAYYYLNKDKNIQENYTNMKLILKNGEPTPKEYKIDYFRGAESPKSK